MKKYNLLILTIFLFSMATAQQDEANWTSLNQRKISPWFHQNKVRIFIHWGLYAVPSNAPVIPNSGDSYVQKRIIRYWFTRHRLMN